MYNSLQNIVTDLMNNIMSLNSFIRVVESWVNSLLGLIGVIMLAGFFLLLFIGKTKELSDLSDWLIAYTDNKIASLIKSYVFKIFCCILVLCLALLMIPPICMPLILRYDLWK